MGFELTVSRCRATLDKTRVYSLVLYWARKKFKEPERLYVLYEIVTGENHSEGSSRLNPSNLRVHEVKWKKSAL